MQTNEVRAGLDACVHCGLCLNACPTYLETGSEADSPRGRLVMMRALHTGRIEPADSSLQLHLDRCLGCRACETACPSAVPYGHLLENAREALAAAKSRPLPTRIARRSLNNLLAHPGTLRIALKMADVLPNRSVPPFAASILTNGESLNVPPIPRVPQVAETPLPVITPAAAPRRFRVGMLRGCVMTALFHQINTDTAYVLSQNGCEVLANMRQGCCGALHAHSGDGASARAMARSMIDAWGSIAGLDAIVVNSAGCGSAMKDYGSLLKDDPAYADRAALFAAKVRDVCEWLDMIGIVATWPKSAPVTRIAYHDPCHLAHGQQVTAAPRRLLNQIPGVELMALAESDVCCGSAGTYNFTQPKMAAQLQQRKLEHIQQSGAEVVAAGNPGCLAWIEQGLTGSFNSRGIKVVHPVSLLADAFRAAEREKLTSHPATANGDSS